VSCVDNSQFLEGLQVFGELQILSMESFGSSPQMIGEQMVPILIMSCCTFVFLIYVSNIGSITMGHLRKMCSLGKLFLLIGWWNGSQ
jgi:hypothetical protein